MMMMKEEEMRGVEASSAAVRSGGLEVF